MKKLFFFSVICGLFLLAAAAQAQEVDCSMCHPEKAQGESVHPAVSMGCTVCHAGVNASDIPHKFSGKAKGLTSEGAELCFTCHDKGKFSGEKTVHMPVGAGMCTSCHDPHASGHAKLLLSDNVCVTCHDKNGFSSKKHVHPPVGAGMCTSCHNPHQSPQEKLLKKEMPLACYDCHKSESFYGPTVHSPVMLGMCTSCHNPHQSDNEKLMTSPKSELCFTCHDKSGFENKSTHKPVSEGNCTGCHRPHASQNEKLVIRKGNLLCRSCHANVEKQPHALIGFTSKGHPLRGRKDPKRPGKTFGCMSCHVPHSSESPKLFRYKTQDMFGLCSHCHKV